jgi:hypothetical protein
MAVSSIHNGWRYDPANSRLDIYFRGTRIGHINASGLSLVTDFDQTDRGTVTQATNKTTGVTLNNRAGTITTNNAALAAAAEATFTVTNSTVAATDVIACSVVSGGTSGEYLAHTSAVAAGSFDITLANMSAASASDAVLINFVVLGAA